MREKGRSVRERERTPFRSWQRRIGTRVETRIQPAQCCSERSCQALEVMTITWLKTSYFYIQLIISLRESHETLHLKTFNFLLISLYYSEFFIAISMCIPFNFLR